MSRLSLAERTALRWWLDAAAARADEYPALFSAPDGCVPRCIAAVADLRWEARRSLISDVFRSIDPSEAFAERLAMLLAPTADPDCPTRPNLASMGTIAESDPPMNALLRRVAAEAVVARSKFIAGELRLDLERLRGLHHDLLVGTIQPTISNSGKFAQAYASTLPSLGVGP